MSKLMAVLEGLAGAWAFTRMQLHRELVGKGLTPNKEDLFNR